MRKIALLVLLLLMLPVRTAAVETVQSMVEELPSVEEFQSMDSEAQLDAYNRTQAAYDAYIALPEEEKAVLTDAEETFETLFAHYNTLIAPAEEAPEGSGSQILSTILAALVGILLAKQLVTKKKL